METAINLSDIYKKLKEIEKNMVTKQEFAEAMKKIFQNQIFYGK